MLNKQTLRGLIDDLEDLYAHANQEASEDDQSSNDQKFYAGKAIGFEVALRRLYDLLPGDE